ncbi:unnamed protein product [Rhizopus microsporus]
MDKWFDDQLKKMDVMYTLNNSLFTINSFYPIGGNEKAKEFFESQPEYSTSMTTTQKYHSRFATAYRQKLSIEATDRPTNITKQRLTTTFTKNNVNDEEDFFAATIRSLQN